MPTLALFCSLCCASARHRLSHLRPSNLSFLFPPLNVVYEGRLTRWEANDKSWCRDRIRDGEGKKNLARLEMCLCFILYRIRKLKKTRKERSNQVQQQLDFYQTIQSFGSTEVFYLCSAAWCIMHTRRCQIRLLCDFFFLCFFFWYFFSRCCNCKWNKGWGGGFQATDVPRSETVLLTVWRCTACAVQGRRGNLRRPLRGKRRRRRIDRAGESCKRNSLHVNENFLFVPFRIKESRQRPDRLCCFPLPLPFHWIWGALVRLISRTKSWWL